MVFFVFDVFTADLIDASSFDKILSQTFAGPVEALTVLPNDIIVAASRNDNYLYFFVPQEEKEQCAFSIRRFNMNESGDDHVSFTCMHLSFSPKNESDEEGGQYLLVSTDQPSGRLILFRNPFYATCISNLPGPNSPLKLVKNYFGVQVDQFSQQRHQWHPSGKYFYATSDADWSVYVFDLLSSKCVQKFGKEQNNTFDDDFVGRTVVNGGKRGEGHRGLVRCLDFDQESNTLITGSFDCTVKIWAHQN